MTIMKDAHFACNRKPKSQSASCEIEFLLSLPLIILFVHCLLQACNAFERHQHVSKVAYEVARFGASNSNLEICNTNCATLPGHSSLISRAKSLLQVQGFDITKVTILTARTPDSIGDFASDAVLVEIIADNKSQGFGSGVSIPAIHTSVRAPYIM
jgi:hypothetical protein